MTRIFRLIAFALTLVLTLSGSANAMAQIDSYGALLDALSQASNDDILIITGVIAPKENDPPLRSAVNLVIRGTENSPAELVGVRIDSMNVGFSNVTFSNGLQIQGNSNVQLMSGTRASGASGHSAITMKGRGSLQIDRNSVIIGGESVGSQGGDGIVLDAGNGSIQIIIDGRVTGGQGRTGGSALTLSGLSEQSSVRIAGMISGGAGSHTGGNAINLYDFSQTASMTLSGTISGGAGGRTGGNAIQIVNVTDGAKVELAGSARGGDGASYGGDTVVAMNVTGSLVLTGQFRGGDISPSGARPGAAVLLLDEQTTANTRLADAQIEDGQVMEPIAPAPEPEATPEADSEAEPEVEPEVESAPEPEEIPEDEALDVPTDEEKGEASPGEADSAA